MDNEKEYANEELIKAVVTGDINRATKAIQSGADVNAPGADDRQWTRPLHEAARFGNEKMTALLIASGANVNARNIAGRTPLHAAAWCGKAEIIRLMIDAGADINAQDKLEQTPLDLVSPYVPDIASLLKSAATKQGHAGRIDGERKDKGTPQVGG